MIRGLYGIADAGAAGGDPERLGADLLAGGCRLLQLRAKDWSADDILICARSLSHRCRAVGAVLIVNDWPEIAVAADAHGVHVGQLDQSAADVRRIVGPNRIVGRSTGDISQLGAAMQMADYVAFGPVWPTQNAGRPKTVRSLHALAEIVRAVDGAMPVVAIGGIDEGRIPQVRATGVAAWAVIGAIASAGDPIAQTKRLILAGRAPLP